MAGWGLVAGLGVGAYTYARRVVRRRRDQLALRLANRNLCVLVSARDGLGRDLAASLVQAAMGVHWIDGGKQGPPAGARLVHRPLDGYEYDLAIVSCPAHELAATLDSLSALGDTPTLIFSRQVTGAPELAHELGRPLAAAGRSRGDGLAGTIGRDQTADDPSGRAGRRSEPAATPGATHSRTRWRHGAAGSSYRGSAQTPIAAGAGRGAVPARGAARRSGRRRCARSDPLARRGESRGAKAAGLLWAGLVERYPDRGCQLAGAGAPCPPKRCAICNDNCASWRRRVICRFPP